METKMNCPNCNNKLSKGQQREFETLSDHVCDPNREHYPLRDTYVCKNTHCLCSKEDIFWDESGDLYGWSDIKFENDLSSAYPSLARKLDIEIYKKGLKKKIYLSPILMLGILKPVIEFNYKSDDCGNVIKKSWSLKWLKKDKWYKKDRIGYHIYYTFPIINIIRHFRYINYIINNIKGSGETKFNMNSLKRQFEKLPTWDKRWWRHVELFLSRIIYKKWYNKVK